MVTIITIDAPLLERLAWINGTDIEADATYKFTVLDGVTYRAELEVVS